jgi:hypothetical protein
MIGVGPKGKGGGPPEIPFGPGPGKAPSAAEEEAAESPEEEAAEYPSFSIPEGLDLSDLKPGDEKQMLCTVRKTDEGNAEIISVDGVDLVGGEVEAAGEGEGLPPAVPGTPPPPGAGLTPAGIRGRAMGAGLM